MQMHKKLKIIIIMLPRKNKMPNCELYICIFITKHIEFTLMDQVKMPACQVCMWVENYFIKL